MEKETVFVSEVSYAKGKKTFQAITQESNFNFIPVPEKEKTTCTINKRKKY